MRSPGKNAEWVAISFSTGSSWSRDQTHVSCVGKWVLYHWATREDHAYNLVIKYNSKKALTEFSFLYKVKFTCKIREIQWGLVGFPGSSNGKESTYSAADLGFILGLGRSPGGGHGYPLQYSWLENSMDRGAWQATVHGVTKSRTWLSD